MVTGYKNFLLFNMENLINTQAKVNAFVTTIKQWK